MQEVWQWESNNFDSVHLFLFKQLQLMCIWIAHIFALNRSTRGCFWHSKYESKKFDKMTNQITPFLSTVCPNKAWGKRFILQSAIYDYKMHYYYYHKITIYTKLALQTIRTSMYTGTVGFEGSDVFVPLKCNSFLT